MTTDLYLYFPLCTMQYLEGGASHHSYMASHCHAHIGMCGNAANSIPAGNNPQLY